MVVNPLNLIDHHDYGLDDVELVFCVHCERLLPETSARRFSTPSGAEWICWECLGGGE